MALKLQQQADVKIHAEPATKSDKDVLKAIVDHVRGDSTKNSDEYVEETKVPHGGE